MVAFSVPRQEVAPSPLVRRIITIECLLSGWLALHVGLDYLPRMPLLAKWNFGYEVIHALLLQGRANDLLQDYGGARALLFGGNAYEATGALARRYVQWGTTYLSYVSTHPPTVFVLFLPLAPLSFGVASAVWAVLMLCGLAVSIRICGASWVVAGLMAPILILLPPVAAGVEQLGVALLVLVFLAYRFRDRPFVAGVLIGVAALTKFVPVVLLVPFLVRRQWSAVTGFAFVCVSALALVAALNVEALAAYVGLSRSTTATWMAEPSNGAFLVAPWLWRYGPLGIALPLAVVVWVLWTELQDLRRGGSDDRGRWARWNWLSVALLPIVWDFSLLPLALSVVLLFQQRRVLPVVVALAGFAPVLVMLHLPPGLPPFWCTLCTGVALGLAGLNWRPTPAGNLAAPQSARKEVSMVKDASGARRTRLPNPTRVLALLSSLLLALSAGLAVAAEGDWPTYHHDAGRSGVDTTGPNFTSVEPAWTSTELDGDIYAEPLYVGGLVLIATETNSIYALSAASGEVAWQTYLGPAAPYETTLKCGNIRPMVGITSTPVADLEQGIVYAIGLIDSPLHYELFAVDIADGSVHFSRPIDPPGLNPRTQGQRGALALANGMVYATFGNRSYPSCEPWFGWVVAASSTDPSAELASYSLPNRGGIWAPAGATVDADGNLLVATGDGPNKPAEFPRSESVIKLSPTLTQLDLWAPQDWAELDKSDLDIGSVSPTLLPEFGLVFQGGKNSYGYLLQADNLGGIGGDLYQEQVLPGQCGGIFGGTAYLAPLLYVPCGPQIIALRISASRPEVPSRPGFSLAWKGPALTRIGETTVGSPIVAGGAVWHSTARGHLVALDALTGELRFQANLPGIPAHFATPTSGGGRVYAAGGHQIAAFSLITSE